MSGGHYDYKQYHIQEIAENIQEQLNRQGKLKPKEELWMSREYYIEYPEEKSYPFYPEDVQKVMKDAVIILRKAYVYAQRIDWYLSGDDGDETFIERLEEELSDLKRNNEI